MLVIPKCRPVPIPSSRLSSRVLAAALISLTSAAIWAQTDLALKKPATASSVQKEGNPADYKPAHAVDGDGRTRWGSDYKDSQWIEIDLQGIYSVSKVMISWEDANPNTYRIDVSADRIFWDTLARMRNMSIGERVDTVTGSKSGRYIRMFCEKRNQSKLYLPLVEYNGMSIWSFRVFGSAVDPTRISKAGRSPPSHRKGMPKRVLYDLNGKSIDTELCVNPHEQVLNKHSITR